MRGTFSDDRIKSSERDLFSGL